MFHLFNKIYLKHETLFDTSGIESLILTSEKAEHPLGRLIGFETALLPSFSEILEKDFSNSTEVFWESLLKRDSNVRFDVVADSKMLNQTIIEFWKSIFKNPDPESIYRIYQFSVLDHRLKSFLHNDFSKISRNPFYNSTQFISKSEFMELYEKAKVVSVLHEAKKGPFSFEYLLADYLNNPNGRYLKAFKEKVRTLAWKKWINDADVLKAEILNDFYNIKKIAPDIKFNFDDVADIEKRIADEESLSWMLDEKFNEQNADYIRRNYSKEIFLNIHRNMILACPTAAQLPLQQWYADDQMLLVNLVFDEDFEAFFEIDMTRGFGCSLTGDQLRQKANQIFVSYLYDKMRTKQTDELKAYELA